MPEKKFEIADLDGRNRRTVTLAEFRAEHDERKSYAQAIAAAVRAGDIKAVEAAQAAMRARFA